MSVLRGKTAIVTGAGQGIGRGEALALAREGALVVVNDVSPDHAARTVEEVRAMGGLAETNVDDVADWAGAARLIEQAVQSTGRLDVLVCNAGNLRDRMVYNLAEEEWDTVMRVHLRGHAAPIRHAANHWRALARQTGERQNGRIITTTSEAGMYGNEGQANYSAAKAGIVGLTLVASRELAKLGVTVNAISPRARTQMTTGAYGEIPVLDPSSFDEWDPEHVGAWVAFLASDAAAQISGQVFVVYGATVSLMSGWSPAATISQSKRWTMADLLDRADELIPGLQAVLDPFPVVPPGGQRRVQEGSTR